MAIAIRLEITDGWRMSKSVSNDYVAEILNENTKLKAKVARLEKKLASRKQKNLDEDIRLDRKQKMAATWEPGGINYHKSKVYQKLSVNELRDYHSKFPKAPKSKKYLVIEETDAASSSKKK
tara:strand:+ start:1100 stop:1465 length:366 start_codon:yes stop_codon:yes gene_type:complete